MQRQESDFGFGEWGVSAFAQVVCDRLRNAPRRRKGLLNGGEDLDGLVIGTAIASQPRKKVPYVGDKTRGDRGFRIHIHPIGAFQNSKDLADILSHADGRGNAMSIKLGAHGVQGDLRRDQRESP